MNASEKRQILVVEDEGIIAADLQDRLERLGYSVPAVAGSGRQALHLVRRQPFDLALMAIRLKGGMDGIQAARALQRERDVPVVYVTTSADTKMIERARTTDAFAYIVKPVRDRPLRSVIEITIHKHQIARSAVRKLDPAREKSETLAAHLDLTKKNECRRLARLLHDGVRQRLTAIAREMEIRQDERDQSPQARVAISRVSVQLRQLCRDLHRTSHKLHPEVLEERGLTAALRRLCREYGVLGLKVHFQSGALPTVTQAKAAVLLYRVVQEILQNVLQHAGANMTVVSLEGASTGIVLRVPDPGDGVDPQIVKEEIALGLRSLSDRVESLGGMLHVTSKQGRCTEISVSMPFLEHRP